MNEKCSKIQQVLMTFQNFLSIYNNNIWVRDATADSIKGAFKLGHFIEKALESYENKKCLAQFYQLLKEWFHEKQEKVYNVDFFKKANDRLLSKIFCCECVSETTLDIAIRIYTSFYPKLRFKMFLEDMLLQTSSVLAIKEFVTECVGCASNLEEVIILNKWSNYLLRGKRDAVLSEVDSYLSLYKVEAKLPILIKLLTLTDLPKQHELVQRLVLDCTLQKMNDRSILTKQFWISMFKHVNSIDVLKVCINFKEFLELFFNFVEYMGSMIEIEPRKNIFEWRTIDGVSFCPEIGCREIMPLLKLIYNSSSDLKYYVRERVQKAKNDSSLLFWDELHKEISA